ncbi:hypothetical protein [Mycobacterium sp. 1274761.0]|uniref:hypothetical protein n=1 Tax=Mycobacterium sp. 1274761.0 TaxID=1834077 RepID=UPI0012E7B5A4|nr:hypothetical protein [Mycobacterium sp. 1274761.0]
MGDPAARIRRGRISLENVRAHGMPPSVPGCQWAVALVFAVLTVWVVATWQVTRRRVARLAAAVSDRQAR